MKLEIIKTFFEGFSIKYILIFLPFWLEFIDYKNFAVNIPGFPYTLGMVFFMLNGIPKLKMIDSNNSIVKALVVIFVGVLIGSFFGEFVMESLSRSIGWIPVILSIIGCSYFFEDERFKRVVDLFLIIIFLKWSIYALDITFSGGTVVSYSDAVLIDDIALNHHVPGLYISFSSIYLINRFCMNKNQYTFFAYIILAFSASVCILVQSRSNLLFLFLTFFIGLYYLKQKLGGLILGGSIVILLVFFGFSYFFSDIAFISQRFDTSDTEYLESTNRGRTSAYELFLPTFLSQPLGKGIKDIYIDIGLDFKLLMHNQYATFVLAGGVIALLGTIFLLIGFFRISRKIFSNIRKINTSELALFFCVLIFLLTLTTIELFGGSIANFMFSMLVYLGRKHGVSRPKIRTG